MNPVLVLKSDNPIYRARLLKHRIGITLSVAAMLKFPAEASKNPALVPAAVSVAMFVPERKDAR